MVSSTAGRWIDPGLGLAWWGAGGMAEVHVVGAVGRGMVLGLLPWRGRFPRLE